MKQLLAMKTEVTGQGRPLVLVPGGLTGWLSWKPHAERLSNDHKVVRVQLLTVDMGLTILWTWRCARSKQLLTRKA
jgi:hypothetical protein